MPTFEDTIHKDFQALTANVMHGISGAPPTGFRLILTNGLTYTHNTTMANIAAAELADSNGYARQVITFTAGTWDGTDVRHELADVTLNLAPSGGNWTFNGFAIAANATATIANSTGTVYRFANISPAITINDGQTYSFTIKTNLLDVAYATTGQ